jgi:Transglutaminase-like superfamily
MPGIALFVALCFSIFAQPPAASARSRQATATTKPAAALDRDSDGDGLPDFQEIHKYRTDPAKKDTAGKGIPDGEWNQRREFTYSVRAVIRVMPPYNLKALNDDYQDARVIAETKDYIELEVIAYPLNTNAEAIDSNPNWQKDYAGMQEYLAPGVTTNWDASMRRDLLAELAKGGIDPDRLTDKELVEQVSRWYYARSKYHNMFCTNFVHFPDGKPAIFPGLEAAFDREKGDKGWSANDEFTHEILGKEMFYHRSLGTCTSSAGAQATVLRALGIPTRIILTIPVVDASDPEQVALVDKNLKHHGVRTTVQAALLMSGKGYTNHTYLEVFVGNRWQRLNYTRLGQNTLDSKYMGLMIHVHTFNDLSEANLASTWGVRYGLGKRDDVFRHSNPYRTMTLDDHFGTYANVPNPPVVEKEHKQITIDKIYWHGSTEAPAQTREAKTTDQPAGTARLWLHGEEWWDDAGDYLQYKKFLGRADKEFVLKADGHPEVKCRLSGLYITLRSQKIRDMELVIPPAEFAKMAQDVSYGLQPVNPQANYRWKVNGNLSISRHPKPEK